MRQPYRSICAEAEFSLDEIALIRTEAVSNVDGMITTWSVVFDPLCVQTYIVIECARLHGLSPMSS